MSINNVLSHVVIVGATYSESELIKGIIREVYEGSDGFGGSQSARNMLDYLVASNRLLEIEKGSENSGAIGGFHVSFNIEEDLDLNFITSTGLVLNYDFNRILVHEMLHAILATSDFEDNIRPSNLTTPGYDYVGGTVLKENLIFWELGDTEDRNSYFATISDDELDTIGIEEGQSLTHGNAVDLVIVDRAGFDKIDTTDVEEGVLLVGLGGSDRLEAGAGADYLYGGEGSDQITGGDGIDRLYGNDGNDILVGGDSSQSDLSILTLLSKNEEWDDGVRDYLSGGDGNDKYLIYSDRIFWEVPYNDPAVSDAIENQIDLIDGKDTDFTAYFQLGFETQPTTFELTASMLANASLIEGSDYIYDMGASLTVWREDSEVYTEPVLGVLFGSTLVFVVDVGRGGYAVLGGVYDFQGAETNPPTIDGTPGNDQLDGTPGGDIIRGGEGDDQLNGGSGSDQYLYDQGDGNDVIDDWGDDSSTDTLILGAGINPNDVNITRGDSDHWDIKLNFYGGGSVTIAGGFFTPSSVIEEVRFADSTVWSTSDIKSIYLNQQATAGDDFIFGFLETDDDIQGLAGNDELHGYSGHDTLRGGAGADVLFGGDGNDILIGGAGDDFMLGEADSDVFVFESSSEGNDWIDDFTVGEDKIDLSALLGINSFSDVLNLAQEWGGTTWINFDSNNSIRLQNVSLSSLSASDFIF